ncbi:MFS transporter [Ramlibacter sp. AN1015]|uniref:MFS transporter n=1 Tax=Ramlibacter sp. AN1015 TaxID=3133428 RepID=UPI0030BD9138
MSSSTPLPPPELAAARATATTIALLSLAAFFSGAAIRLCDGLIPRLGADFGITPGRAGAVVITFSVVYGVMQLVFGPVGDRWGKARVVCIAVFASGITAWASALAPDFDSLLWLRGAWGAAAAGVIPLTIAWIGDHVPLEQRQSVLARLLLWILTGMMAGQLGGGLFADLEVGWRGAFLLAGACYLLVAALLFAKLRSGFSPPTPGPAPALLAQLGSVLARRWSWWVLAAALAEGVFLLGTLTYLPTYLHLRFALTLSTASALVALYAAGGVLYALMAPMLVRRLGQTRMVRLGGMFMGLGFLAWLLSPTPWSAGPVALLVGFGTYLFHNTLQTHATQMAPAVRGSAVSLFAFCLFFGQAIGTALAGLATDYVGSGLPLAAAALALPAAAWSFARALGRKPAE